MSNRRRDAGRAARRKAISRVSDALRDNRAPGEPATERDRALEVIRYCVGHGSVLTVAEIIEPELAGLWLIVDARLEGLAVVEGPWRFLGSHERRALEERPCLAFAVDFLTPEM